MLRTMIYRAFGLAVLIATLATDADGDTVLFAVGDNGTVL